VTIRRGEAWGAPGELPAHGVVCDDDADAQRVVTAALRAREPIPPLGLTGGDLCRTLGGIGRGATTVTCDLGVALLDGRLFWFVSSLVARPGSWWRGRAWLAMNGAHLGEWNVAPRAHPGDGLLDILDVRVGPTVWPQARRRMRTGAHVPHPAIAEKRTAAAQVELERPMFVWLDGVRSEGKVRNISVRVEPDALTVVV
jgi:hypothetical protein